MSLDLSSPSHIPLSARIAEFSEDPQNMDQMKEFIDGILNDAEIEVNKRLDEKAKVSESYPIQVYVVDIFLKPQFLYKSF